MIFISEPQRHSGNSVEPGTSRRSNFDTLHPPHSVRRGVAADAAAANHTVALMPQGKAKSGCPHEPQRPRLPLGDRFGMLRPGVNEVVEAVTMR
jgi:hypothetical protein